MKNIIYAMMFAAMAFVGCNTLDIKNIYNYNADMVWNDEKLAAAYLTNIYGNTFGNWDQSLDQNSQQLTGIVMYPDRITITNGEYKSWDYSRVRLINDGIENISNGGLSQAVKDNLISQLLFLRAYTYFKMVIYHGGVPYITKPQDKNKDDLYVKRNSTKECFDFIIKDIDEAIKNLPTKIAGSSADFGKIDACFASAFKAKVLLYKASPQFNPTNPWNNMYWNDAYTAAKTAYDLLLTNGAALTPDYNDIWLQERGPECIFSVINTYPNKVANWDNVVRPGSESRSPAFVSPIWEFVKELPMKDGKVYSDPTGKYFVNSEDKLLQNYWKNRDPRFEKSIVWNGSIYELSGKKGRRQYTSLGIAHELDDFGTNPAAGINSTNMDRASGFFIRKIIKSSLTQAQVEQYDVDFIVMRFAEMMLIYAETCNETGKPDEALNMLYQLRRRAGIEPGSDNKYGITAGTREEIREAIIQERNIELCFEGHRFFDLRRLGMLSRLDNQTKTGVEAIAINADGTDMQLDLAREKASKYELTESNFRYVKIQIPISGVKVTSVPQKYSFFPIQQSVIDQNSKIEQNKNWGGTFDPAL